MSEYRETTTVEEVAVPEPEPVVTLAELVGRIDWNVGASNLEGLSQPHPSNSESRIDVCSSNLEDPSVSSLFSSEVITIPASKANETSERLKSVAWNGTTEDILQLGRDLAIARQERLLSSSLNILRESCLRSGFDEVRLHPEEGVLVALESGTTHRAVIEIEKAARGQVGINFDMDGFRGGACVDRADSIIGHACELGLKTNTTSKRRKSDSPVAYRRNLPNRTVQRNG